MANVLPLDDQKRIRAIYRSRFVATLSLIALTLALLTTLALIPSFFELNMASSAAQDSSRGPAGEDASAVAYTQALIKAASPILEATSTPVEAINSALKDKPSGVRVEHITYTLVSGGSKLMLTGTAPRESVNAYRVALGANESFDSVNVPLGALVGAEGGRFQFTLTGTF